MSEKELPPDDQEARDPIPFIIDEVRMEVVRVQGLNPGKGVDLRPYEASLRELLREAHEVYQTALDDWWDRNRPDKPKRQLEANWAPDEVVAYDYSDHGEPGEGLEDWDGWWQQVYHRGRGNPGQGRLRLLPVAPLYPVYGLVRRWWISTLGKPFRPNYPRDPFKKEEDPRTNSNWFNPAGRLFLMIVQELNSRYTARTCYGVQQTAQKKRSNKP